MPALPAGNAHWIAGVRVRNGIGVKEHREPWMTQPLKTDEQRVADAMEKVAQSLERIAILFSAIIDGDVTATGKGKLRR